MKKTLLVVVLGVGLVGAILTVLTPRPVAAQTHQSAVEYDSNGKMKVPTGFRKWVFVGAPLTPEGLNNGKYNCNAGGTNCTRSNFPEYHHVYIEQKNVDAYLKTGEFPEGTVIVKELTRVLTRLFQTALVRSHPDVDISTARTTASTIGKRQQALCEDQRLGLFHFRASSAAV